MKHIRNHGYENNIHVFYFEAGRRCPQKGRHALVTKKAPRIFETKMSVIALPPCTSSGDTSEYVGDKICVHNTSVLQET